jgi:aminoglycoside 3-N-acetyltransferase
MSEADVAGRTVTPVTVPDVVTALRSVGVVDNEVVIVHSSLSRLGWVVGGALTVVHGLLEAVGPGGTIVMPAQTGIGDPAAWENPPVPEHWWPTIREHWPAFDPQATPLRGMGAVVECFRRLPDVRHSGHPAVGFVARGAQAEAIVHGHQLESSLDDSSPLGHLYRVDARVVLIGVGHANNTSLHLAEHRADYPSKQTKNEGAPLLVDGVRRWIIYEDLDRDDGDLEALGAAFVESGGDQREAPLGIGAVTSCNMRDIVDFATTWFAAHR